MAVELLKLSKFLILCKTAKFYLVNGSIKMPINPKNAIFRGKTDFM